MPDIVGAGQMGGSMIAAGMGARWSDRVREGPGKGQRVSGPGGGDRVTASAT